MNNFDLGKKCQDCADVDHKPRYSTEASTDIYELINQHFLTSMIHSIDVYEVIRQSFLDIYGPSHFGSFTLVDFSPVTQQQFCQSFNIFLKSLKSCFQAHLLKVIFKFYSLIDHFCIVNKEIT